MGGDAARDDAGEVSEVGCDVQRKAMEGDPVAHPNADGADFIFSWTERGIAADPDADPVFAALARIGLSSSPNTG